MYRKPNGVCYSVLRGGCIKGTADKFLPISFTNEINYVILKNESIKSSQNGVFGAFS